MNKRLEQLRGRASLPTLLAIGATGVLTAGYTIPVALHEAPFIGKHMDSGPAAPIGKLGAAEAEKTADIILGIGKDTAGTQAARPARPGRRRKPTVVTTKPAKVKPVPAATSAPNSTSPNPSTPEACIAAMPLQEKLGQMIMIGVNGNTMKPSKKLVAKYGVGGVIIMGQPEDATDGRFIRYKQGMKIRPFMAVDEEGGSVQRLRILDPMAAPEKVAASMSPSAAQAMVARHGVPVHNAGFDVVFGPLVDIAPATGVSPMRDRVFGNDLKTVMQYSAAYRKAWQTDGMLPFVKHFPGIGAADANTDDGTAKTPPYSELKNRDLLPYMHLDPKTGVMVSNAHVPGLSPKLPASLNPKVIGLLRNTLKFNGLVITDTLNAQTITDLGVGLPKAVEMAIRAGNDIALTVSVPVGQQMKTELPAIMQELTQSVGVGKPIPISQVNASVRRILTAKQIDPCTVVN